MFMTTMSSPLNGSVHQQPLGPLDSMECSLEDGAAGNLSGARLPRWRAHRECGKLESETASDRRIFWKGPKLRARLGVSVQRSETHSTSGSLTLASTPDSLTLTGTQIQLLIGVRHI